MTDTNTAEREAVARAIWALMREHEDRCDEELEDLSRCHPVWEYADAARASLAASAGSEPVIGWHAFPHYLQHPDGRLLRTASDLLARHGYTGCAEPLRAMSDVLLSTHPSPPEGMAGWKWVPVEPTEEMKAAAVKYANGTAVYKNVKAEVLRIEEGIYGEVYEAMIAAAPPLPASEAKEPI
ncbi:hypothetical protein ACFOW3_13750 [Acidovorax facilis]|uniref:Uncharacterized protein n=1 Tax=Acidovorax facilis TaxID=12917 RepID=A0ABV8DAZ2_9BURK|nr:hypothetical protein [Acidovorax facilis]MCO4240909.1 hypothetical protein [Acidovorax facilis]